ncbi:hypothetical protein Tco_0842771 [Tanacetum coccineum]|uniref:Uncharacterized protein n=1 Tax=Tanacetum coccineum TaxID=301880 RepID=A0ABQ5B4J6_9ASTR
MLAPRGGGLIFYQAYGNLYATTDPQQEEKVSSTDTLEDNPKIQAFRRELEQIALKHLGTVPENNSTSTPSVNTGSQTVNTWHLKMREGVKLNFNSLPTEIEELIALLKSYSKVAKETITKINSIVLFGTVFNLRMNLKRLLKHLQDGSWDRAMQEERYSSATNKYGSCRSTSLNESDWYKVYKSNRTREESFISQDKYVAEILKKFVSCKWKAAKIPMETKRIFKYLKGKAPNKLGLMVPESPLMTWKQSLIVNMVGSNLDRNPQPENCCGPSIVVQKQLLDYGLNFMNTKIHIDNESTICIVKNPVYHSKTKHIEIRHHFIRDCYEKKLISVEKIHTDLNVADLLTKPFDGPTVLNYWCSNGYTITEASIRDTLQLADATGITMLPNDEIFEGMGQMGIPTEETFQPFGKVFHTPMEIFIPHLCTVISSKSGGWDQFGSNIATALIYEVFDVSSFSATDFEHSNGKHNNLRKENFIWLWTLPKKIFGNMKKWVFVGHQDHLLHAYVTFVLLLQMPVKRHHCCDSNSNHHHPQRPVPSTSSPPVQSPPPIPASIPTPTPIPETEPAPFEHTFEEPSPVHQHFSPPQEQAHGQMTMDDLLQVVPQLISRIDSLETDLKQTKLTMGNALVKLVKKVKKLEGFLKRRNVVLGGPSGRHNPNTLEASQNSLRVASRNSLKSIGKGKDRNKKEKRLRERSAKKVLFLLLIKPKTGKAPMISEETPKKSKEQILQEEASLAEAIRLDTLQKEEVAKQVHLDSLLAQRIAEEEELNEQQKKRRAQVQFEAQHYTDEDWDLIRAKIEANAELSKSMLGSDLQGEDFARRMNQGTWKLSQLKNLSFEEVKEEFDKLVKHVESFAPINFEATKASLKRFGEELQTKTTKRLKDDEAKDAEPAQEDDSEGSDEVSEQDDSVSGTKIPINPVPVAMKSPSIATYKIIKQGEKGVYQERSGKNIWDWMDQRMWELEKEFWKNLKNMV